MSLACIAAPFAVVWQRQHMYDWWRLHNYVASADIAKLATDTSMTDKARNIFYVNRPQLYKKQDFRQQCVKNEQTIVLGCFKSNEGIYIYNVNDARLAGIIEVTAAHEFLHAAYDRLSTKERSRVDALTAEAYKNLKDERIKRNVESYRSGDATVVPNELHSILGTEVAQLPAELETYYKTYFSNRPKIVAYSQKYEKEFSTREATLAAYDKQIDTLKNEIDAANASLKNRADAIDAESSRLDSLRNQNRIEEYNAGIPGYKYMVDSYNRDLSALKAKITKYKNLIDVDRKSVV